MSDKGLTPGGATRVAAVIGSPIRHSLSPMILNAAFQESGLDWIYTAFEVAPGAGAAALDAMRVLGLGGLSVTMPHKEDVAASVDRCDGPAQKLGAVNCVVWRGGELVGHSTDGDGLVDALRAEESWEPDGKRCVVIGAGGAARAAVLALAGRGASEVVVVNRTSERGAAAAGLAGSIGRVGNVAEVADADLVVNATPIGMTSHSTKPLEASDSPEAAEPGSDRPTMPFDPDLVGSGQIVVDMIYTPLVTPVVDASRARGATALNGVGMLVHQAAHAFTLWTGESAPVAAMTEAVLNQLNTGSG